MGVNQLGRGTQVVSDGMRRQRGTAEAALHHLVLGIEVGKLPLGFFCAAHVRACRPNRRLFRRRQEQPAAEQIGAGSGVRTPKNLKFFWGISFVWFVASAND
eukprot:GHVT01032550.1.p1 GENE.GHVT01032550.1~~GHVT01032550.1.p1  ORF type:complete len:102 (+),score=17.71 GHVT01032550.1:421-726(+)